MLFAIILGVFALYSPYVLLKLEVPMKKIHELFIDICGVVAFVAFALVMVWLEAAMKRGEYPIFSLWPIALVGFLSTISALRANKTYKDRYVTTPASQ